MHVPSISRWLSLLVIFFALASLGCGGGASQSPAAADLARANKTPTTAGVAQSGASQEASQPAGTARNTTQPPADAIERKIIYSGQLTVVVKDLDESLKHVDPLLEEYKGYIAKSEILSNAGTRRSATFTVRVPAENFRKLKTALIALGIAEKNTSDSKDVTEEFVDITSRVKNLKTEEETLNKLLKDTAHRLEDILRLREEIKRLRGEIEVAEGRLKYISALASLSTLEVTLREVQGAYKPPEPDSPLSATFRERISNTFTESVTKLRQFGEAVAVLIVGIAPWLPILLIGGVVAYRGMKRLTRRTAIHVARRRALPVNAEPQDPPEETNAPEEK